MKNNQENLDLLRTISNRPKTSQRKLANELGFSLGKLNYCIKALQQKGLVKIENFKKNPNKLNYFYVLTPEGIAAKTKLTINFITTTLGKVISQKFTISASGSKTLKLIEENIFSRSFGTIFEILQMHSF